MAYRVKNWDQFQHFKDRRPPWIKLYRHILDDIEWHGLSGEDAKVLVMIWLVASEDHGNLPDNKQLAFRLRITEQQLVKSCNRLCHWLIQDDITMISSRYHDDAPETETETETERETEYLPEFESAWIAYRRKGSKQDAYRQWKQLKADEREKVQESIPSYFLECPDIKYRKDFERYIRSRLFESVLERKATGSLTIPMDDLSPEDRKGLRDWGCDV